jgi:hypothetical protein
MDKITFVCDRGSNLVKPLEDYQVVNCFPHRLNNVLKRTFYSAGTQEKVERKRGRIKTMTSPHEIFLLVMMIISSWIMMIEIQVRVKLTMISLLMEKRSN